MKASCRQQWSCHGHDQRRCRRIDAGDGRRPDGHSIGRYRYRQQRQRFHLGAEQRRHPRRRQNRPDLRRLGGGAGTTLSIDDVTQAEGNAGTTAYTFTVTRSGGTSGAVSADYVIARLAARAMPTSPISSPARCSAARRFRRGQLTQTITINAQGDFVIESNESFHAHPVTTPTGGATITDATRHRHDHQ